MYNIHTYFSFNLDYFNMGRVRILDQLGKLNESNF